jgi:5'-AMP-activated protein kinase catalytic alpha subunit
VNAFHVRVRRKNAVTGKYVKMTLQLYQVDYKSYLLDFKSLPSTEIQDENKDENGGSSNSGSTSSDPYSPQSQCHHIMEFFEMCASLITQLAR